MRRIIVFLVPALALLAGCGGSSGDGNGSGGLGTQIDVMGRAAVNTALVNTFAADADRGMSEDDFNQTDNSARSSFAGTMAAQLAIYDSTVGGCGDNGVTNRASADPADGLATGADRYGFLASVFADDQLYVNTSSGGAVAGQCAQYLAAELGVIGIPGLGSDCGGRTPTHDVIETTYSAVTAGAVTGVDDGIASDNVSHSLTAFPFLAPAS
jgi:hypothetical protein